MYTPSDFANTPREVLVLLLFLLPTVLWFRMHSADPYGLFHLSLNKVDPSSPPKTEWLNMGYWKVSRSVLGISTNHDELCKRIPQYSLKRLEVVSSSACARLHKCLPFNSTSFKTPRKREPQSRRTCPRSAFLHIIIDGLPHLYLADVGHGTGESLLLLLSEPSTSRPLHLIGITSLELHHQRSSERVHKRRAEQKQSGQHTQVDLYHGDAVYNGHDLGHPLCPGHPRLFDSILALDCAYHFNTRRAFLEQSLRKLAPGGTIALADICFAAESLKSTRTKIVTALVRLMPGPNLVSDIDYVASMKDIGYVNVTLEDITPDVFPGFISFLKSRGVGWWIFGTSLEWYTSAGAKFVIVSGQKPKLK